MSLLLVDRRQLQRRARPPQGVRRDDDLRLARPIEKLLAYRERMGWSFKWASSHESDFNFDYGVSAGEVKPHDAAAPLLEANELRF